MDFLANLDADRDAKGQSIVRVYDLLEPVAAFTEAAVTEARADERRNTAERIDIALAIWQLHLDATPLGLRCECVACRMGRTLARDEAGDGQ